MKKYFLYELKKNWLAGVIIIAIACIIYLTQVLSTNFAPWTYDYGHYYPNSLIGIPFTILAILCTLVPVWMFSFKMSARQCDLYYSMPLKREKIYLIKSIIGLLIIFSAFSISYWLGFAATALKENMFVLWKFVPAYFIALPLAVLLFGVNAFVFTRANRLVDGIIFIGLYAFVAVLPAALMFQCVTRVSNQNSFSSYDVYSMLLCPYSPIVWLGAKYTEEISSRVLTNSYEWITLIFNSIAGIAAWVGLFLTARKEKAENAERTSDTRLGYMTLIPFYNFILIALFSSLGGLSLIFVMIIVAAFVGYVIFRRTVRLKKCDWIVFGASTLAGILFTIIWSLATTVTII